MTIDELVIIFYSTKTLAEIRVLFEKLKRTNPKLYNQFAYFVERNR